MRANDASESWRRWVEPWYLAYGLLGASVAGIVPIVLPLLVYRRGGATYTGLVIAAYNLGGLTAPLWGGLADRYRLHRGLALGGVLVTTIALAVFPYTTVPAAWMGWALLQGMGAAGAATMANTFVVETHPEEEWGERLGWLQTFYGGGQVGGLLLAGALPEARLDIGLWGAAGLMSLSALTGWLTTRTPSYPLMPKPTLLHPCKAGEWLSGSPQHFFHHLTLSAVRQVWHSLRSPFTLFLSCWLLTFTGSWAFFSQYPVLMYQVFGVSPRLVASASAVANGLGLMLYVPAGLWSERRGSVVVLQCALSARLLAFCSLFGLGLLSFDGWSSLAILCVIAVVLSWPLLNVSGTALTARLSPVGEGEGIGLFNASTALAGVTGAGLGGWVAEHWTYQAALMLPASGVALGLILTLALSPLYHRHHAFMSYKDRALAQDDA